MSVWKQLLVSVVLFVAAAVAWVSFFPGAPEVMRNWGLDWAVAAVSTEDGAGAEAQREGGRGGPQGSAPLVVTSAIETATINDRLTAIGTGRAVSSVVITPFATGRLTELLVQPGESVEAGAVIARLDSDAEEIALDRATLGLEDAESRFQRITALRSSNTVTEVQLSEARNALSNAQLALRDAELSLDRRSIVSPIGGVVGILPVSVGNYVTSQTEIATIDDRSRIVVEFWVPERFAGVVAVGQPVSAVSVARPSEPYDGIVSAIDNRIDAQSRTLRVQASIDNDNDALRAGMSFQVTLRFPGDEYPSIDPLAVQWGTDGAFIWIVENAQARRAPVNIVQRNTESVLVTGDFGSASAVVIQGIHGVREGAPLNIVRGAPGAAESPAPQARATTGT